MQKSTTTTTVTCTRNALHEAPPVYRRGCFVVQGLLIVRREHTRKMAYMNSASFFVTPGYGDRQRQNFHYSQAVRHGNRVETSGQGGWDDNWCFPESVRDEVIQAVDNVERTLATAGASWRHVISVHSYHLPNADGTIGQDHLATMAEQFRRRMGERAPVWTCIGVAALANPTMRVEIQVTALIDDDG
jgi:enamine deaminase RidA (YjgF/YER057c/UK114 family)